MNSNYPRYFTCAYKQGYGDDTAYLRVDQPNGVACIINKNGNQTDFDWSEDERFFENECLTFVAEGHWKEISKEEAKKLIKNKYE